MQHGLADRTSPCGESIQKYACVRAQCPWISIPMACRAQTGSDLRNNTALHPAPQIPSVFLNDPIIVERRAHRLHTLSTPISSRPYLCRSSRRCTGRPFFGGRPLDATARLIRPRHRILSTARTQDPVQQAHLIAREASLSLIMVRTSYPIRNAPTAALRCHCHWSPPGISPCHHR